MLATIAKQFTFHAAHRLPHHDGLCKNLHGHSYTLEVLVTGPVKPANRDADEGMVLDFGIIKEVYKFCIEPHLEHRYLNESLAGHNWADGTPWVPWTYREPPPYTGDSPREPLTTCENLATWIQRMFDQEIPHVKDSGLHDRKICVRLWETPTSYAEVGDTPWRR
jgi:6-pyruvoyltetrahydropterin/6-carboxytetrahydropterin synthase